MARPDAALDALAEMTYEIREMVARLKGRGHISRADTATIEMLRDDCQRVHDRLSLVAAPRKRGPRKRRDVQELTTLPLDSAPPFERSIPPDEVSE